VRSHQEPSANVEVRGGNDRGGRQFRHCARTVFGIRRPCKLDRCRHLTNRRRITRRTLGCDSGRGHKRAIEKWRAYVRKDFSKIQMKRSGGQEADVWETKALT